MEFVPPQNRKESLVSPQRRILIVDDEPVVCMTLRDILTSFGYQVTALQDAAQTKEMLAEQTFGLLISDISMPGFDGMALLAHVEDSDLATPVILLSGFVDDHIKQMALDHGARACSEKPVKYEELLARVEAHLVSSVTNPNTLLAC